MESVKYVSLDDVLYTLENASTGDYGIEGWMEHDPDLVIELAISAILSLPTRTL